MATRKNGSEGQLSLPFIPREVRGIIATWLIPQVDLPRVVRWKPGEDDPPDDRRRQSCDQHTLSITMLAPIICAKLTAYQRERPLDELLVAYALLYHDVPEGLLGRDVIVSMKQRAHEIDEYQAFRRMYEPLGGAAFETLHRAYLLQHVRDDDWSDLPADTHAILQWLKDHRSAEAHLFRAIELWDYLLYAWEQYDRDPAANWMLLTRVLDRNALKLDDIAPLIPGFAEEVWRPEFAAWCHEFVAEHKPLRDLAVAEHIARAASAAK